MGNKVSYPIRVLHILGALDRGGAETMIMNLYRNIDRTKIQFDFIIHTSKEYDYTDEIRSLGGKIYSMDKFKGYNCFSYIKQFCSFFKVHREYKIIHGHMRSTASLYLLVAKKYKLLTIAHSHNTSSGKGISALVKDILQYPIRYIADYFFACSKEAGIWLFGEKIVKGNNFFIIKNAIDIKKFIYDADIRKTKRKELGLENEFVIGNIARFHEQKNHVFILDVFNSFLANNPNSILVLVGEGNKKTEIQEKVNKLNITNKVILLNSRGDINELMQAFDVFLFPSKYEGLGIVAIEAQCASLPVLCSEFVPKEVEITKNIEFLPIDNIDIWVQSLQDNSKNYKREAQNECLYKSGYDIHETVLFLFNFYLERWDCNNKILY